MVRTLVLALTLVACKGKTPATPVVGPLPSAVVHEVRKSPLDERGYRYLELDNGLRAVIVHDPDTDKSAASLSVNVGHLVDPPKRQGLAHFLEHMLFMGTDEFPDVDAYRRFIQDHGGRTNAGTGTESTTYYFEVSQDHLVPSMDRFSRFFVAPKLDKEYVEREREAVNSEYSLKIKEDVRRIREVKKKTRNPAHPYSKFSVGNLDFLGDREGEDLHADLRDLYAKHYVGDNMTLSVLGRESLDELEALVRREFRDVPTRTVEEDTTRPNPYLADQLGVEIRIVPERDVRQIQLIFPVPSSNGHLEERPVDFLTDLIGDEGEGSLFAVLKQRGWAQSLSTGEDGTDDFSLLTTTISLTEEGYANRDEVTALFFAFIEQLRTSDLSQHFDEQRRMGELNFRFAEELPATRAVQSIARGLPYVPVSHILDHSYRFARYDEELIKEAYLSRVTPDQLRLVVIAKDVETDKVESLYSTPYAIEPLSDARKREFLTGDQAAMAVRPLNPYVATAVDLKAGDTGEHPVKVESTVEGLELWHMFDTSFGVPRAYTSLQLTHAGLDDVQANVKNRLFVRLLNDQLESFRYPLRQADLSVRLSDWTSGFTVSLAGYDDKQPVVLAEVVQRLQAFSVDPVRFELEKTQLIEDLENTAKDRPVNRLFGSVVDALVPDRFPVEAQLDALRAISVADLEAFSSTYFDALHGRMMVHGNVTAEQVKDFASTVDPIVGGTETGMDRLHHLAPGEQRMDVSIDHADSTIAVAFHGDGSKDAATRARFQLAVALLRTDFFTELRTKQQLGYIVFAGQLSRFEVPGLVFAIQSSAAGPVVLEERIDAFLAERPDVWRGLSDADFEVVREGLISDILESENRLSERNRRLVSELGNGHLAFDSRERLVEALRTLTKAEMVSFFEDVVLADDARRLVARSNGTAHGEMAPAGCQYPICDPIDSLPTLDRKR